ncbi:penicillin-binding protein 2 [Desulfoplanes formicivorans]|uniref:Penicillin-binding protein n=1 Tax=Desulfoplanes formicivorans TaxID=1592317 RepID=A0A194AIV6_9BACT|nr:penicillin-binding protein 2 [Desulfoplanes formicivorans]GAU08679.1 penicillin-binding protein [Desulfoplanes formicivorans]
MPRVESDHLQGMPGNTTLLYVLVIFLFCLFGLRLWYLQVYKGEYFDRKSRDNRIRRYSLYAPRGLIRDTHGVLLAENQPSYALSLVREDCPDIDATLRQVAAWTRIPLEQLRKDYERGKKRVKPFDNQILVPHISFDQVATIESHAIDWPGLNIVVRPKRYYPQGPGMTHVLGYVAQANEEELNADPQLALGDNIGKLGLEFVLENVLRGKKGLKECEVDAAGRILAQKELAPPVAGQDVLLSIDLALQNVVTEALKPHAGAVVVLEAETGKVLALVSEPSYDNNAFVGGIGVSAWKALLSNPRHPLQNRSIQSTYPPGSVFKLVMAACGLQQHAVRPEDRVFCPGSYRLGNRVFRCWKRQGHGFVDMKRALVESCDVYFYQLGESLGIEQISAFAKRCGFGKATGISLPHEKNGLIPDRAWKWKRYGRSWQKGETLNVSIGQGSVLVTPLQVAVYLSALVNGGRLVRPNLLKEEPVLSNGQLPFGDMTRQRILDAMIATVEDPHGTARRLKMKGCRIGGKTGTAQVVNLQEKYEKKETHEIPYQMRDHAWMASFGMCRSKKYVVVALVEHGGHGGSDAGPVVRTVYEYLFAGKTACLTDD